MKDIGKIGFVLKGDYDNIAEYECLDVVRHNGSVYVSKRTTSGNEPVGDDDNWMLFIDGQNGSSGGSGGSSETTITIDDFLSMTSENTVQNKVITLALDNKVDKVNGKGLSTNDYTDDEKKKNDDNSIAIQNLEQNYNTTLTTINEINTKVTNVKTYVAGDNITFTENEDGTTTISSTNSSGGSSGSGSSGGSGGDSGGGSSSSGGSSDTNSNLTHVINPTITNGNTKVTIKWEDPADVVVDGNTVTTWAGTKLVMSETNYPTTPDDGTLLVDSTTRDAYKTDGFAKTDLVNDKVYYFTLFPYSTDGKYNSDDSNRLLGRPTEVKIVTFADGTDEEIVDMIEAHYANKINIADYWAVGDKRSVDLSAMNATYVVESHRAQTVEFAIADFEHDDLVDTINGHTKAAVTLTQVDCLMDEECANGSKYGYHSTEIGNMNSTNTNVGDWTDCARRKWCNEVYCNALQSTLKSTIKEVKKLTSAGSQSGTLNTTNDKVFLLSEIEIFGSTTYSDAGEGNQYSYYKTTANRCKNPKWSSQNDFSGWCERSPYGDSSSFYSFCSVDNYGNSTYHKAVTENPPALAGIAPCFCL